MQKVATLAALALLAVAPGTVGAAEDETLLLPPPLVEHARQLGCRPVADFDTRPGVFGQPFAYGYLPGPAEESAVYWCERGPAERPVYRLVLVLKDDRHEAARCPRYVEWGARIGGLSVHRDEAATLDGFVPLDHRAPRPPPGTRLRHAAIRSEHDGVGTLFYCHDGWWFVRLGR